METTQFKVIIIDCFAVTVPKGKEELPDNSLIYSSAFQCDNCFVAMSLYFDIF